MRETIRAVGTTRALALALGAAAVLGIPTPAESGAGPDRERGGRTVRARMTAPSVESRGRARGRIVARRSRGNPARDRLALEMSGLHRGTEYTLACDDPAKAGRRAEPFARVKIGRGHRGRAVLGGGGPLPLPHGATLDRLEGTTVEVRDPEGVVVLTGTVPSADGTDGSGAADVECRFVEENVLEDLFDGATAGSAPPDWTVTGTDVSGIEVVVDDAVFDGDAGASVRLGDTVAADPGARALSRTFTAGDLFFAVEFTLITNDASSRTAMLVSDASADPAVVPTGLGAGLGFHEDGSIGFGGGDDLGTYAADTAYRFRVDFDLEARTFDVSIDGTAVVTARDLGFTGASLDTIAFAGSTDTTGTAWVDTVRVIHEERDCAPTANAGPDQTLECAGATTSVVLDGSASADPEGAELTYTWTGDFAGGTATGAAPTVEFSGLGAHVVKLVVNDGFFDSVADEVTITFEDTTPPELSVTGLPTELWPPNHQLIALAPIVVATDLCDGEDVEVTLEIRSNEADDGLGDGSTTGDWVVRSASDFDLRAERSGPGSGRVYTLVWTARDHSGNETSVEGRVTVPHDRGRGRGRGPK